MACCRRHTVGYERRNGSERLREKRQLVPEIDAEVAWYELDRLERMYDRSFYDGQCRRDGLQCTCNGDRCL